MGGACSLPDEGVKQSRPLQRYSLSFKIDFRRPYRIKNIPAWNDYLRAIMTDAIHSELESKYGAGNLPNAIFDTVIPCSDITVTVKGTVGVVSWVSLECDSYRVGDAIANSIVDEDRMNYSRQGIHDILPEDLWSSPV